MAWLGILLYTIAGGSAQPSRVNHVIPESPPAAQRSTRQRFAPAIRGLPSGAVNVIPLAAGAAVRVGRRIIRREPAIGRGIRGLRRRHYDAAVASTLSANRRNPPRALQTAGEPLDGAEPLIGIIANEADRYILRSLSAIQVPPSAAQVQTIVIAGIQRGATGLKGGRLDVQFDPWNGILEVGWTRRIGRLRAGRRKFNLYAYVGVAVAAIAACYQGTEARFIPCLTDGVRSLFPGGNDTRGF